MDDVVASVGFAGWAFAAMCDHVLFAVFIFLSFDCSGLFFSF